jgi:serine O-acetyltransferase
MDNEPSSVEPDWSREAKHWWAWSPGRSLLASIRAYAHWSGSRAPWCIAMRKLATLRHRFWSVVSGADIPLGSRIAGGLLLPHPNGIVIHPDVEIGPNCLIFQQVTLGGRAGDQAGGVPSLGGHVDVGAGAKLLGPIRIGAHARIGANAVVVHDVPERASAMGIPARIVPQKTP